MHSIDLQTLEISIILLIHRRGESSPNDSIAVQIQPLDIYD